MGVFLIHLEPIEEYALTPRGSPENYTWFQSIPVFRPKRYKNPSLWGGTYLYGLYKGVRPGYWLSRRWRPEGSWGIQILALSPSTLLKHIFRFYFSIQQYSTVSFVLFMYKISILFQIWPYVKPFDEFMEIHLITATDSTFQYSPYDNLSPLPARIQNRVWLHRFPLAYNTCLLLFYKDLFCKQSVSPFCSTGQWLTQSLAQFSFPWFPTIN